MSFQPEVTEGKVRSMTTTAIITAMESEYDSVRKLYDFDENGDYPRAHVYGRNILLVKAGIGKVNAALAAKRHAMPVRIWLYRRGLPAELILLCGRGILFWQKKSAITMSGAVSLTSAGRYRGCRCILNPVPK